MTDSSNRYRIHLIDTPAGPRLVIPDPPRQLSREEAVVLASWLIALAGASMEDVAAGLERVQR